MTKHNVPFSTARDLNARIYNGLDARQGWPVIVPRVRPAPVAKKSWWRLLWPW